MKLQNIFLVFPTGWGDNSTHAFTPNFALFSTSVHHCYQNPPSNFHSESRNSYPLVAASTAACVVWIDMFNDRIGMSWMTSGSHGQLYANWALPGAAGEQIEATLHGVDGQVVKGVNTRLKDMLSWLNVKSGPRRISDVRVSSGYTSEYTGEMRRARLRAVLAGDYAAIPCPKKKT